MEIDERFASLPKEEREEMIEISKQALVLGTTKMTALLVKSIGIFFLGCAAFLLVLKYLNFI